MANIEALWEGGPQFIQSEHFKLGTDSVLLADFVNTASRKRGIDLGCGSGILPMLLMQRSPALSMTGLEINPAAAEVAQENLRINGLFGRGHITVGDIRECRSLFPSGSFELAVANPPYFVPGSGKVSPDADKASARAELDCTLRDVVSAASYLCPTGGSFCLVQRTERLTDLLCLLREYSLEPKRLRFIAHSARHSPSLVLVEARRGAASGLKVLPTLYLRNDDGSETEETLRIYHREGAK